MVVVAAGRGSRAGEGLPKQYRDLAGIPVLARTLSAVLPAVDRAIVVIHSDDRVLHDDAVGRLPAALSAKLMSPVHGGETRSRSVMVGLEALATSPDTLVGIHDAARPFVDAALIGRVFAGAAEHGAAIPGVPVVDTIKRVQGAGVETTLDRGSLRAVQTPQVFRLGAILEAYHAAIAAGAADMSDDAAIMERADAQVAVVDGDAGNIKLTTPRDFEMAELLLGQRLVTRVGTGYDVHAFGLGRHVTLCGVAIPHDRGVIAHSDGDVAYHALCDAIFGALGDGDIGRHFPPSDMRWKDAASGDFLRFACGRIAERGGLLDHVDISIICEAPRIGPFRELMAQNIMQHTGLRASQIGLKATTSERLGFIGRGEGLAAFATATLRLPEIDDG